MWSINRRQRHGGTTFPKIKVYQYSAKDGVKNYPMSDPDATVYIHTLPSLIQNYMYRSEKRTNSVQDHNVTPNRLKGTCSYNCMHYAQNNRRTLINVYKVGTCNHMDSV